MRRQGDMMAANRDATILYIGWDGQPHNYMTKVIDFVRQQPPEGNHHVRISHDDWCAFFKAGVCDCDPEVREMHGRWIVGS